MSIQKNQENRVIRHGIGFQRSILRLMMQDHNFCERATTDLYPGNFTGNLSWFFRTIKDHFQTYHSLPTVHTLEADISKHDVAKQIEYTKELHEIVAVQINEPKIKAEMTDFIRANIFVDSSMQAALLYNKKDYEVAYTAMRSAMDKIAKVNFGREVFSKFGDYKSVLIQSQYEMANSIPTGIDPIDQSMGGLLPGTLTVFLGAANVGKSMLMPNLAYHAAKAGKRVFVTIHEDEENPTKMRYLSRFSGVPYNKLKLGVLTPQENKAVEDADKLLAEFVVLRFMYTKESFIETVLDSARSLFREWQFDLFLCDYGQCLKSAEYKATEKRHLYEHVYNELKQLCLELKICGASVAQVNRAAVAMNRSGADFLRMTDVGESFGIAQKASNVITMNRSAEDIQNNRIVFLLDKVRNGKCPIAVTCVNDYSRCITHIPHGALDQNNLPVHQSEIDMENGPAAQAETTPARKMSHAPKNDLTQQATNNGDTAVASKEA